VDRAGFLGDAGCQSGFSFMGGRGVLWVGEMSGCGDVCSWSKFAQGQTFSALFGPRVRMERVILPLVAQTQALNPRTHEPTP
jgi:hypothetical protein